MVAFDRFRSPLVASGLEGAASIKASDPEDGKCPLPAKKSLRRYAGEKPGVG
jgi:hypothetical protein